MLLDDPTKQHFRCGHPKTSDNLRSIGKGKFKCRQCDTERDRQRFANMSTAEKERRNARKRDARRPTPIEALQQRVERLEVALRTIADGPWPDDIDNPIDQCKFDERIARAALGDDVG